jgi:hypothetical protein
MGQLGMLGRIGTVLVVLLAVLVGGAGSASAATTYAQVIALGGADVSSAPVRVGSVIEVGVDSGVWVNGTVVTPTAPSSDPSASFFVAAINSSGVAVGSANTGAGADVPAYWNPAAGPHFTEVDISSIGGYSGSFSSIDAAGDASGNYTSATGGGIGSGLFMAGSGGVPSGTPQVVSSLGAHPIADPDANTTATCGIPRVSAGYELACDTGSTPAQTLIYNRQTGTAVDSPVAITQLARDSDELSDDGYFVGTEGASAWTQGSGVWARLSPDGTVQS